MPILWSAAEVAAVTGGTATQDWFATGAAINVNELQPGDLYFATRDDDLEQVFKKGAVAAVVARGGAMREDWPLLQVADVFQALQDMARAARFKTHATVLAVQGKEARGAIGRILRKAGSVHNGGRHLSLGLANLPEEAAYGLFSLSPTVRPDIAVISDCARANRDTLLETMPAGASVIINADDEGYLSIIARAKAAGVENIYTYGRHPLSDARVTGYMRAANGSRFSADINGEAVSFLNAPDECEAGLLAAALLILKITGGSVQKIAHHFETGQAVLKTGHEDESVCLIDPLMRDKKKARGEAVFKITNMIDLGMGRQTAVLDNFTPPGGLCLSMRKKDLAIPRRLAHLDFVYAGKTPGTVTDAQDAIRSRHKNIRLEPIAPDVVSPGDFLVFKQMWQSSKTVFSEALRPILKSA